MNSAHNFPKDFDCLIIGGGVVGLSVARALHRQNGGKIAVLEKNAECGRESSNAAAGMLAPQAEAAAPDDFLDFTSVGRDFYKSFAVEIFAETQIDIELDTSGTLYLAFDENDSVELEKRFRWQKSFGLAVEKLSTNDIRHLEPQISTQNLGGLFFPNDWQVENKKLCQALFKYCKIHSLDVLTNSAVKQIVRNPDDSFSVILADGEILHAEKVIAAGGAWTSLLQDELNFLQSLAVEPVRGQILSFAFEAKHFRHVVYSPRCYLVPRRANCVLIGATVEKVGFQNETTAEGERLLRHFGEEITPLLIGKNRQTFESGLRPKVGDGLPVLGAIPNLKNLFIATAHYRNGILLAPLSAELLAANVVKGEVSRFLEVFGACRFDIRQNVVSCE